MIKNPLKNPTFGIRLMKGKVYISLFSFIAAGLLFYADFSVYTLIIVIGIAIHELSHIVTLKLLGGKIKKINVYPFGIDMISDMSALPYSKELVVVSAGCISNLISAFAAILIFGISHSAPVCFFIYVNLVLGIGNLLPLPVFDGGRILHIIILQSIPYEKTYIAEKWADRIAFSLFFTFCIYIFRSTECNLSVVVCVCYTAISAILYEKLILCNHQSSKL